MLMMAEDDRQKPLNNLSEDANDDRLLNGKERQGPKVPQERDKHLASRISKFKRRSTAGSLSCFFFHLTDRPLIEKEEESDEPPDSRSPSHFPLSCTS